MMVENFVFSIMLALVKLSIMNTLHTFSEGEAYRLFGI